MHCEVLGVNDGSMFEVLLNLTSLPGSDVTIANRSHGDDWPVQGSWHGDELVWVGILLHHKGQTREYQHTHDDHQPQQPKLLVGILESCPKSLETSDVSSKTKYSKNTHDPEHLGHPPHLILIFSGALHVGQGQGHKVGDNTKQVYDIHTLLDEMPLLGWGNAPDQVFNCEPGDENSFCNCKISVFICLISLRICDLKNRNKFTLKLYISSWLSNWPEMLELYSVWEQQLRQLQIQLISQLIPTKCFHQWIENFLVVLK